MLGSSVLLSMEMRRERRFHAACLVILRLIFAHWRQYEHVAVGHLCSSCRLESTFCPSQGYIPWIAAIYTKLFLAHIELLSGVPPHLVPSGKYALFLPAHYCALPASSGGATILAIKISRTQSVRLSIFSIELAKCRFLKIPPCISWGSLL